MALVAKHVVALLVGATLLSALPARAMTEDAIILYNKGVWAYKAGNINGAIELFAQAIDGHPYFLYPQLALARIYQDNFENRMTLYEEAVQWYESVTAIMEEYPPEDDDRQLYESYFHKGLLYLKGGDYGPAKEALEYFLEVCPEGFDKSLAFNAIGIADYYLDHYDEAANWFRKAVDLSPDYQEARFNLRSVFTRISLFKEAQALSRVGDIEAAFARIERLKEFAPRYLPGRRLEAQLHLEFGEMEESLNIFGEILSTEGDHPLAYSIRVEMAKVCMAMGQDLRAKELLLENRALFADIEEKRLTLEVEELLRQLGEPAGE